MKIRKCKREDLEDVYEIERVSFPYPYPKIIFYDYIEKLFFVAEEKEKIIGYVIADDERSLIVSIAVHPEYRNKGYGKKLMEHVLKLMKGKVFLQVRKSNKSAISFYHKMGFKEIKEIEKYYMNGENAILMFKKIG
ncbi:MAG TPA: ribosomal-protein-alanine N-acetyltransferase [Thermoplasmata archaeon]|nr:ribosomal-protein-alanine N-acetyltransferase [Thermoplasmata archaeon]